MVLFVAAALTVAAAGQPDTNAVWTRIPGGPGTGCAHDSSYAFFVHAGDPQRLAIFLNGGGACWNSMNCDLHARPTYHSSMDSTDVPDQHDGLFDLSNPRNPIRGYTVVFIPYCIADVLLGARTVSDASADTAADQVQLSFLALLGVHDVSLAHLLAANLAEIRKTNPVLHTYTAPGALHTILRRPEFYSLTVEGIAVRDWVAALLDGSPVTDVGQSLLP